MANQTETPTVDSKYIQQHLANERTYLAWIRTSIAIIGIGFVIANLHFTLQEKISHTADVIAISVGALAFLLGTSIIIFSSHEYIRKRNQINEQTFKASLNLIMILTGSLILCLILLGVLFIIYLLKNFM